MIKNRLHVRGIYRVLRDNLKITIRHEKEDKMYYWGESKSINKQVDSNDKETKKKYNINEDYLNGSYLEE